MICENPSRTVPLAESAVQSVNGKPGPAPSLNAEDVGAASSTKVLPYVLAGSMGAVVNREGQSLDLLNVEINIAGSDVNAPYIFGVEDPSLLINSPYSGGPFYGYRQVIFGGHLVTVVVVEQYPVSGRIWGNTYDHNASTWYGWKASTMQ